MFSSEICKIFKTIFFYRTPPVPTSETKHIYVSDVDLLHIRIGNLDWIDSHEKKTKNIHASAADLLHIRIENLDGHKCGHWKNEAREIECFCCRWMQCLFD